jgi:hypothetical protein
MSRASNRQETRGYDETDAPIVAVTFCDALANIASGARDSRMAGVQSGARIEGRRHTICS